MTAGTAKEIRAAELHGSASLAIASEMSSRFWSFAND
jgi:hypothetical protein